MEYRGRFAPSPTGHLHLGGAASAIFAAAAARRGRGALVVRVEDLDAPRVRETSEGDILDDLAWLGLRFDEGPREGGSRGPYRQSERLAIYEAALAKLAATGETFLCDCSRADIARAASAPHEGDDGPPYPGTCRSFGMDARPFKRPPAVRLAMREPEEVRYVDGARGEVIASAASVSDFVLRRGDGVFSYQLACAVDDVTMRITEAVRGADLASSAVRQARIASLLGARPPIFTHVPLLVGARGERLAKRDGGATVREHREAHADPRALVRSIAGAYGHDVGSAADPIGALAEIFDPKRFPIGTVPIERVLAPGAPREVAS